MGEQTQILSLSGGQTYDNHLNNPGDHSYDFTIADMNKNISKNSNSLSILNANVRSLSRNYSNFTHYLNSIDIKFSLLSLTES